MYEITPLDASFGAEVRGWDPGRALRDDESATLRAALGEYTFLLFRGQRQPSDAEFSRLGTCFGELINGGELYGLDFESRDVLRVSNELDDQGYEKGYAGSGYLPWHSDYSFRERAAKETLLEAVSVPPNGPRTHWVNTYLAYEGLDDAMRKRVEGLVGRHDPMQSARHIPEESRNLEAYGERMNPEATLPYSGTPPPHPIAHPHPETGRVSLYVSAFVAGIDGMPDAEAQSLVDALLEHTLRPEWTYSHEWRDGDLVVFDTVGTVHSRDDFPVDATRSMRQMSTLMP